MLNPRRMKRRKPLIIGVIGIVILFLVVFFGYKIFTDNRLSSFDLELNNINCTTASEVEQFLRSMNMNYFYYKSESVEYELRRKYFCIGNIDQTIHYPNRLKIVLTGREGKYIVKTIETNIEINPQVILSLEQLNATESTKQAALPPLVLNQILDSYKEASESSMYVVDAEGVIFESAASDAILPRISIFGRDFRIGQKIPDDLIKKVDEISVKVEKMEIDTTNLIVVGDRLIIDSSPRVTFSLSRDIPRQLASLQLILRQAKMNRNPEKPDSRSVESIDLRFDRPVVIYSK